MKRKIRIEKIIYELTNKTIKSRKKRKKDVFKLLLVLHH
jgi:hypothetical protein